MVALALEGFSAQHEVRSIDGVLVIKATRDVDGQPVLLKLAGPEGIVTDVELRHEYRLLKRLPGDLVRRALGLARTADGAAALVLERTGHAPLTTRMGVALSLEEFFPLARRLCRAVARLHDNGVLHQRLSPAHISVDPATGDLKLQGFSRASPIGFEIVVDGPSIESPERLRYLAPEQTGHMNRGVDLRTDLYSLGAILYELLTGRPAFPQHDPGELVHALLARPPPPLAEVRPDVPAPLSRIVSRLLAKNAEDRFPDGLALERALAAAAGDETDDAPQPYHGVLVLPERLYGRDEVFAALRRQLAAAQRSRPRFVTITGPSGIGKTALARELQQVVAQQRGAFIEGKFDAFNRNRAFAVVLGAVASLVRHALALGGDAVAALREDVNDALGPLTTAFIEAVPGADTLLDEPFTPRLRASRDARRQRELALVRFLSVFARPSRPLVVFLDDLQWADAATIRLIQTVVFNLETPGILIVGAYSEDETPADHPLRVALDVFARCDVTVDTLALTPLARDDVALFLHDTLGKRHDDAHGLIEDLHRRSRGNPYELREYVKFLFNSERLRYDGQARRWRWELATLPSPGSPLDAAALVNDDLDALPGDTREALLHAACLGTRFDVLTLATALDVPARALASRLSPAVHAGLALPVDNRYHHLDSDERGVDEAPMRFRDQRVRQAAYERMSPDIKQARHLAIGWRLLARARARRELPARVVEIVTHLNNALALVEHPEEREELAALNLEAGRQAKAASAHEIASRLVLAGLAALQRPLKRRAGDDQGGWIQRDVAWPIWAPELRYALHFELVECLHQTGQLERAQQQLRELLELASGPLEEARARSLQAQVLVAAGRSDEAIEAAHAGLRALGESLPTGGSALADAVRVERAAVRDLVDRRGPRDLLDRPLATQERHHVIMDLLNAIVPAASGSRQDLFNLCVVRSVDRSVRYGYGEHSAHAFAIYGLMRSLLDGEFEHGFRLGQLAVELNTRLGSVSLNARIPFCNAFHAGLCRPLSVALDAIEASRRAALENGDAMYLSFACSNRLVLMLANGDPLPRIDAEAEAGIRMTERTGMGKSVAAQVMARWYVARLRGQRPELVGAPADERAADALVSRAQSTFVSGLYALARLHLALLDGDLGLLRERVVEADACHYTVGYYFLVERAFLTALALAGLLAERRAAADAEGEVFTRRLEQLAEQLDRWAQSCPENHLARAQLVAAERARARGDVAAAIDDYDRAIESARRFGHASHEALACERAASFHLARGSKRFAFMYYVEAVAAYRAWGARACVERLERTFGGLERAPELAPMMMMMMAHARAGEGRDRGGPQLRAAIAGMQTINAVTDPARLVDVITRVAVRVAGAQRGALLRERDGSPRVVALHGGDSERDAREVRDVALEDVLPRTVLEQARRAGARVVLDDATHDPVHGLDPYVQRVHPRSLLLAPLRHDGRAVGALYLENTLTTGVFTELRVELLELVLTQAARALADAEGRASARSDMSTLAEDSRGDATRVVSGALDQLRARARALRGRGRVEDELALATLSGRLLDVIETLTRPDRSTSATVARALEDALAALER